MEEFEDLRDYQLAVERLAASEGKPTVAFSDLLKKDVISQADLDAMENVEFELMATMKKALP